MSMIDSIRSFLNVTEPSCSPERLEDIKRSNRVMFNPLFKTRQTKNAQEALRLTENEVEETYLNLKGHREALESVIAYMEGEQRFQATKDALIDALRACVDVRDRQIERLEQRLAIRD